MSTPRPITKFDHYLALRLAQPNDMRPQISPANNIVGTLLLTQLIKAELALDGLPSNVALFGDLNHLRGLIGVDHLERGLAAVKSILNRIGFFNSQFCELAYIDQADRIWKCPPFGTVSRLNDEFDMKRWAAESEQWVACACEQIEADTERFINRRSKEGNAE